MDYLIFESFLSSYGIHSGIICLIVCILRLVLKKYVKINAVTRSYVEIAVAVFSEFIFHAVILNDLSGFNAKALSSALFAYSISLVLYSLISRIIKGKPVKENAKILLIESLIENYVDKEKKTSIARQIFEIIEVSPVDEAQIFNIVTENLISPVDEEEITALIDIIIDSTVKI